MKTLSLLIVSILIAFMSLSKANALLNPPDCPDGFTNHSVALTYNLCSFGINFCYKCGNGATIPDSVINISICVSPKTCIGCDFDDITFQQWVLQKVSEEFYFHCCGIAPCNPGPIRTLVMQFYICYLLHNVVILHRDGTFWYNNIMQYPCYETDERCTIYADFCMDFSQNPPALSRTNYTYYCPGLFVIMYWPRTTTIV